ncbi:carboxypeptidase-like regulatory domain-containing protein [Hymenobacter properus]|uniref:Carboxypeptidase-like regulatory domain-containing protein n=1 Tax=Hymenobacter properus TaxID=2791026 RepID=A0A931BEC6_9BACT|nr:carboxypeptidase-like regulatory domain-containing protein [Hymenobacter properus]MBF9140126.1 carboxypeptidase-like regulatory domain-containing protein [Hymenobacter properus]MBR7718933.1 carboxypeptidase-like regulatory domain-containing protein [Microvirga sp. SRT04]
MNPENLPKAEEQPYDPNLEAQDEDVTSGGNNRLTYILVGVILALVVGYVALPKGHGSGLSSVTPSFMLDDAAVTAKVPTAEDSIAAGLKAAPAADQEDAYVREEKAAAKTTTTRPANSTATVAAAPVAAAAPAAAPATAPVATAEAPAPAPAAAPAAPASVTMSGKIEDENGKPLVGATVLLKGSSKGTSTDANGNYSMEVPAGSDNTLIYGYGGYEDQEVHSRGSQPVDVTLTPRAKKKRR